ncbi:hypothetical protein FQN57_002760 [Myotisia sp. PD_48]|nr:hypothetical protein FQN57_002760 [Myotisia sp. PD_48]
MSPIICGCVICGYYIDGFQPVGWVREFRAVYSNQEGCFITGVGVYDDPNGGDWIAPSNPSHRWDDKDHPATITIPVMQYRPDRGFILHDPCWRLLQKAFEPETVPLDRLYSVCKSLPSPLRGVGVCWGHDYGGLNAIDYQKHYPWEDRLTDKYYVFETYADKNPYDVPELDAKFHSTAGQPKERLPHVRIQSKDFFAYLPWELLEAIAIELRVDDVLNLVRASKSFFPIHTSQTFWASRFTIGRERDFLFEKRPGSVKEPVDWIALYRMTTHKMSPPGLINRKRIWPLVQEVANLLRLRLDDPMKVSSVSQSAIGLRYRTAMARIAENSGRFEEGCRLFQRQYTLIPPNLTGICCYITNEIEGDAGYICGMRFVSKDNPDICLGYTNADNEIFLEVSVLKGFILAMGSRGIRALQVIDGDGQVSRWAGCPKHTPITADLAGPGPVRALGVGIDAYKLVILAVSEENSIAPPPPRVRERSRSIRSTELWYPQIPSHDVLINDPYQILTIGDPRFTPMVWTHFGGPNGIYLRSITEISINLYSSFCSIEFQYNIKDIPPSVCKFGLLGSLLDQYIKFTRFPIDGPGGELIQKIDIGVTQEEPKQLVSISVFKISTNFGRIGYFLSQNDSPNVTRWVSLSVAPGSTITGLWGTQKKPRD